MQGFNAIFVSVEAKINFTKAFLRFSAIGQSTKFYRSYFTNKISEFIIIHEKLQQ